MEKNYKLVTRRPRDGGDKTPLIIGVRLRKEENGTEDEDGEVFQPLTDEQCKI